MQYKGRRMMRTVRLKVLNDPFCVELAERGLAGEGVRDGRALRVILDHSRATSLGRRRHGGRDGIAGREADA